VCFISVEAPDLTGFIRRFTGKTAYNGTRISPQKQLWKPVRSFPTHLKRTHIILAVLTLRAVTKKIVGRDVDTIIIGTPPANK
jgi:hypothetical protein